MARALLATITCLLSACHSPQLAYSRPFGGSAPGIWAASPTASASDTGSEEGLRRRLANPADTAGAQVELAQLLGAQERHEEALQVLQQAIRIDSAREAGLADHREGSQRDRIELEVARASILRDMGRRFAATRVLKDLASATAAELPPDAWFALVTMQWLERNTADAVHWLDRLQQVHAGHPWLALHRDELDTLAAVLDDGSFVPVDPEARSIRDRLADLRHTTDSSGQLQQFEALAAVSAEARQQACVILLAANDAAVRARAIAQVRIARGAFSDFVLQALRDPESAVRRAAAARAAELPAATCATLLLPAMAVEQDPATFATMHATMCLALDHAWALDSDALGNAEGRREVVEGWRRLCSS